MLAGRPVLCWSIDVLRSCCSPVVLVVPPEARDRAAALVGDDITIVAGGDTRQASVRNALQAVTTERVVIHDAVRPFVTQRLVAQVLAKLDQADATIPVVDVTETLKVVHDGRVRRTLDRRGVSSVQTPQAFRTQLLREAHERAAAEDFRATDDAQLVERYGGDVVVVPGSRFNLKLTYAEDFELAESLADRLVR